MKHPVAITSRSIPAAIVCQIDRAMKHTHTHNGERNRTTTMQYRHKGANRGQGGFVSVDHAYVFCMLVKNQRSLYLLLASPWFVT